MMFQWGLCAHYLVYAEFLEANLRLSCTDIDSSLCGIFWLFLRVDCCSGLNTYKFQNMLRDSHLFWCIETLE